MIGLGEYILNLMLYLVEDKRMQYNEMNKINDWLGRM